MGILPQVFISIGDAPNILLHKPLCSCLGILLGTYLVVKILEQKVGVFFDKFLMNITKWLYKLKHILIVPLIFF